MNIAKENWSGQGKDFVFLKKEALDCGHPQTLDAAMVKNGTISNFTCAECQGRANTLDDQINRAADAHVIAQIDANTLAATKTAKTQAQTDLANAKNQADAITAQTAIDEHDAKVKLIEARGVAPADITKLATEVTTLQAQRAAVKPNKGDLFLVGY